MPRDRGRSTLLRDRGKYDLAIIDSTDFSLGGAWSPGVHRQLKSLLREVRVPQHACRLASRHRSF